MTARIVPGLAAMAFIASLVGGAFLGLGVEAARNLPGAGLALDGYMLRVARFTLWQAALSTLLSVGPALLVARALSRHPAFPGRRLILQLFALPLALPAIVAALGILALLGRAGLFGPAYEAATGSQWQGVYGLSGILVAHVFFNLPLATRLFLQALETVQSDQWRLAAQLGMRPWATARLLEWPALRTALPGVAGLVFMLCVTSFTIVLTLGGGPAATTIEVAIYQALRFDFDPARAVMLTLVQIALTAVVLVALKGVGADTRADANLSVVRRTGIAVGPAETGVNAATILIALLVVGAPMAAVVTSGLHADLARLAADPAVHQATLASIVLAFLSASLAVALAWSLAAMRRQVTARRTGAKTSLLGRLADGGAGFVLVVPPIVIGAGWFVLLRQTSLLFAVAPIMVVAVNAVMAMPFVIRAVRPELDAAGERHDRLCAQLGIAGLARFRLIDWPVLRRPLATGFAFAMALSLGDLGVIALFGSDSVQTLPYLLLGRMGSYRTEDAAGLALVLGLLCLALVALADRFARAAR